MALLSAFRALASASDKFVGSSLALMAASKSALAISTPLMASVTAPDRRLRSPQVGQSTFIFFRICSVQNYTPKMGCSIVYFTFFTNAIKLRKCWIRPILCFHRGVRFSGIGVVVEIRRSTSDNGVVGLF
jgi:hypothetical protein